MNIKWDAEKYSNAFSFVYQYGNGVADLIDNKCKSVLDLGCGNGALSKELADRGYDVIGLDASSELLEVAKQNYPEITFINADATNFALDRTVDAVFSNAVFHWIDKDKQTDMLKYVHNTLNEQGQFVFEFGGHGNNRLIHSALKRVFKNHSYEYKMPFYFPTISEYSSLLESNGFRVTYAVLFDRPTELVGKNGIKDWIEMFVKEPFNIIKSKDEKEAIINETAESLQSVLQKDCKQYADYVRIRMKAIKN